MLGMDELVIWFIHVLYQPNHIEGGLYQAKFYTNHQIDHDNKKKKAYESQRKPTNLNPQDMGRQPTYPVDSSRILGHCVTQAAMGTFRPEW